jgi:hypothetical protein
MKGILEDVQLLATIKTMTTMNVEKVIKTMTAAQEEKVTKAITDVAAWPTSVLNNVFQEGTYTNINYGTGQYNAQQNNTTLRARRGCAALAVALGLSTRVSNKPAMQCRLPLSTNPS